MTEPATPGAASAPLLLASYTAEAAYEGWQSNRAAQKAAKAAGSSPFEARRSLGRNAAERLRRLSLYLDHAMEERAALPDFEGLSVRAKIHALIMARLRAAEALPSGKEALRKAVHYYAFPGTPGAVKAAWRTADVMWRMCGDRSVDHNYYTKRSLLAAVYAAVTLYRLEDESEDFAATEAFAERRLNDVVKAGKWLSKLIPRLPGDRA